MHIFEIIALTLAGIVVLAILAVGFPEIGSLVLVWKPAQWTHQYDLLRYTQESETHRKIIRRRDHQWWDGGWCITHWMPLPEKPEEESL